MPVELFLPDEALEMLDEDPVELANVDISQDPISTGEPLVVGLRNTGRSRIRKIIVKLEGEGADHVQLAIDDGGPGIWASAGEPIVAFTGVLMPEDAITFWSRGTYNIDDLEDRLPFEYVVETTSA